MSLKKITKFSLYFIIVSLQIYAFSVQFFALDFGRASSMSHLTKAFMGLEIGFQFIKGEKSNVNVQKFAKHILDYNVRILCLVPNKYKKEFSEKVLMTDFRYYYWIENLGNAVKYLIEQESNENPATVECERETVSD